MANSRPRSRAYFQATEAMWGMKEIAHEQKFDPIRTLFKPKENTEDFTEYLQYEADYKPKQQETNAARDEILAYTREVRVILEAPPTCGVHPVPSELVPGIYLGNVSHAENSKLLRKLGITYILNCAGIAAIRPQREERYYLRPEVGIRGYQELPAEDGATSDITHHFTKAFRFIDTSRRDGRVLIYCPDVNRSGAIAMAYLISKGESVMEAAKKVKFCRKGALFNRGFMQQLVTYARDRGQLVSPTPNVGSQGRVRVKDMARKSHLLRFF